MKFTKLTKKGLAKLEVGKSISENGLCYRKRSNGGTFSLDIMVDGMRYRRTLGNEIEGYTLDMAIEALLHARLSPEIQPRDVKFSELIDIYWQDQVMHGRDIINKEYMLQKIRPFFGNYLVKDIDYKTVQAFINFRKRDGKKPATINRELATLSHIYTQLKLLGYPYEKPLIKLLPVDNIKTCYLSQDEISRLLEVARADSSEIIYLFILIALSTGMRRSEILSIKVDDIDPLTNTILIPKAKAGARQQPAPQYLVKEICAYIKEKDLTDYLFPNNSKSGRVGCVKRAFMRCRAKAGLDKNVTIHTLRHTAITYLVQSGIDFITIKKISGHKTTKMLERYAHHSNRLVNEALNHLSHQISADSRQQGGSGDGKEQ